MLATFTNKLRWSFRKNWPDMYGLFLHHYPDFVFQSRPAPLRHEIPVFVFHRVKPETFAAQLGFLRDNGYTTLDGDGFLAVLRGEASAPPNAVVLTFDDGTASLYSVAYPLLQQFGFKALSFIIPGCIPHTAPPMPSFADFEAGRVSAAELTARESQDFPLCSWEEISEMHGSGVVDFQAHSMYHHLVMVAPQVVSFMHPAFDYYFYANINMPVYYDAGVPDFKREVPLGTPIYRAEPRLAGRRQYFDSQIVRRACINYVRRHGGAEFFSRPRWQAELAAFHRQQLRRYGGGRFESNEEMRNDIFQDFVACKAAIEARLQKKVLHFCFPWFIGSEVAVQAATRAGFAALYWGVRRNVKINRAGHDARYIVRLEDRYIYRLPGKGRRPLARLLRDKVRENIPRLQVRSDVDSPESVATAYNEESQ